MNYYAHVGNNPVNYTDPEGLFWPIDCSRCLYYGYKINKAVDKCRKDFEAKCKTLKDEIKFYESYNAAGPGSAMWNCVIKETGDSNIWSKWSFYCFKCTFIPTGPKPPLPKR